MGYLFLLIALMAGITKGYCGKRTSSYTQNFQDAMFANLIRFLLCTIIGFVLILATGDLGNLLPTPTMLAICALSGIATAVFVVSWLVAVKQSAYMMVDVFITISVLIPLIGSNVFFGESIKLTQWLGIGILFVAVFVMCAYNNSIKAKLSPAMILLMLVFCIASGFADFSQKLFIKLIPNGSVAIFNFYTYIFAALVLVIALTVSKQKGVAPCASNTKKIFGYILIMALCLFINTYFKTLAASQLSAVILYPLNQGCALILSSVMCAVLFKEKITTKAIIGIGIAFAGMLIINLL